MTHRENRTTHHHRSHPARSSHAHSGPTSHHYRYVQWSKMQSYGNRRTKPESKCSGEQNTPPQKSEAGCLTNCTVVLAYVPPRKEVTARYHGGTNVPIDQITVSSVPSQQLFSRGCRCRLAHVSRSLARLDPLSVSEVQSVHSSALGQTLMSPVSMA